MIDDFFFIHLFRSLEGTKRTLEGTKQTLEGRIGKFIVLALVDLDTKYAWLCQRRHKFYSKVVHSASMGLILHLKNECFGCTKKWDWIVMSRTSDHINNIHILCSRTQTLIFFSFLKFAITLSAV